MRDLFEALPERRVGLTGRARLARREALDVSAAEAIWKEALACEARLSVRADAAAGLAISGSSYRDEAFEQIIDGLAAKTPHDPWLLSALGSALPHVSATAREKLSRFLRGVPRDLALRGLLRVARDLPRGERSFVRQQIEGLGVERLSPQESFYLVLIAAEEGGLELPGARDAVNEVVRDRNQTYPAKELAAVSGVRPEDVATFFDARRDLPKHLELLFAARNGKLDLPGVEVMAQVPGLSDELIERLIDASWSMPNDDERRRGLCACAHATLRAPNPERHLDRVISMISQHTVGPYFRSAVADAMRESLATRGAQAVPRARALVHMFMSVFSNTYGDVSFAWWTVARLAEILLPHSPDEALVVVRDLSAVMASFKPHQYWSEDYRHLPRMVMGGIRVAAGDAEGRSDIRSAFDQEGSTFVFYFDAIDWVSRPSRVEWRQPLLEAIVRRSKGDLDGSITAIQTFADKCRDSRSPSFALYSSPNDG